MKIAVCGNIIETENIYRIHPISSFPNFNGSIWELKVEMFNKVGFTLHLSKAEYDLTDKVWNLSNKEREEMIEKKTEQSLTQIENIRNFIIECWNGNKNELPSIDWGKEPFYGINHL